MRALPFCHLTLKGVRCPAWAYRGQMRSSKEMPQTIGEHLRKHRLELRMKQKDVAVSLGLKTNPIERWERGVAEPNVGRLPPVIRFLGYVPFECNQTPASQFLFLRRCCGMTQTRLAKRLGCNLSSVWRWENGMADGAQKFESAMVRIWEELRRVGIAEIIQTKLSSLTPQ